LHNLFEFGLALKGFNGLWQTVNGTIILLASKATLEQWFIALAYPELLGDSNDKVIAFIARTLLDSATSTKMFAALYILLHGLLNIFLAVQLYREKQWHEYKFHITKKQRAEIPLTQDGSSAPA